MTRDLHTTNFKATAGISTFTAGYAIVPLLISSVSEEFGRQPIYVVTAFGFAMMHLAVALWVHPVNRRTGYDVLSICSISDRTLSELSLQSGFSAAPSVLAQCWYVERLTSLLRLSQSLLMFDRPLVPSRIYGYRMSQSEAIHNVQCTHIFFIGEVSQCLYSP